MGMVLVGCAGDDGGRGDSSATQASATDASASASASGSAGESEGSTSGGSASGASDSASAGTSAGTSASTSAGTSEGTSEGTSASSGDATSSSGGPVTSGDTTDPTDGSTGGDACMGTEGVFDFSYLWVANTSQGSISKIATATMLEEGRYIVDPNPGAASSSRTAVSLDGRFVVVANRGTGTITKVAANVDDCVDKNNDGVITTSQNKDDILPYGQDECVIWTTAVSPMPPAYVGGPRGLAWEAGTFNEQSCKYENPNVWVGWHTNNQIAYMGRFDGATGVQLDTVEIKDWSPSHAPYGAAMDGFGNLWFSGVFTGDIFRIDTATLELQRWYGGPTLQPYGNTVDVDGNFWLAGYGGPVSYFNPQDETFNPIEGTNGRHRGIAVDGKKRVWAATNVGGALYGCGLVQIDGATKTFVKFHTFPQCSTPVGVSVDAEGFIWVVDYAGWAWKINGDTLEMQQVLIAGDHYTYSDMTGGGLKGVIVPG
ncbi:MAG: lyase [Myxococcales bacterium]|nr:lyase [Myxococcales bacterium]